MTYTDHQSINYPIKLTNPFICCRDPPAHWTSGVILTTIIYQDYKNLTMCNHVYYRQH